MKAIDFMPGMTTMLAENQDEYFTLPVIRLIYADGVPSFISAWVPGLWERIKMLFGKPIYLIILTEGSHPPCLLSLSKKDAGIYDLEALHKEKK